MPATPMPWVKNQFFTDTGAVAAGYKLFVYDAGTTTKQNTWKDSGYAAANTNPIVLDAAGRADIFLVNQKHKFVLATPTAADPPAGGDQVWTMDNIAAVPFYSVDANVDRVGTQIEWSADSSTLTLVAPHSPVFASDYYVNLGTSTTAVDVPAGTLHNGTSPLASLICEWEVDYASADLEARATIFGTNVDLGSGSAYTTDVVNSTGTRARIVIYPVNNTTVHYSMTVLQNTSTSYEQVTMSQGTVGSLNLQTTDYTVTLTMASGTYTIRGARVYVNKRVVDLLA